eukprot:TRINITY_DN1985_c0_g8_i1.p1 TRINITY_DN1985_c0_g8~~TRINITY_DN1985_c0_g8_i1.p1  ORF type:complete len:799 (+),score=308.04 TRINITY_DN1985_c0_g8_i1:69-2465(+)
MLSACRRWRGAAPLARAVRHVTQTTVEKHGGARVVHCRTSLPWEGAAPVEMRLKDALEECTGVLEKSLNGADPAVTVMTHLLPGAGGWRVEDAVREKAMAAFEGALADLPAPFLSTLVGSSAAHSHLIGGHTTTQEPCFVTLSALVLPKAMKAETKVSHRGGGGLPALPSNISFKHMKTRRYSPFVLALGCRVQSRTTAGGKPPATPGDEQLVTRVTNMFPDAHVACEYSYAPNERDGFTASRVFVHGQGFSDGFATAVICLDPEKQFPTAALAALVKNTIGISAYQHLRPVLSAGLSQELFAPAATTVPLVPLQFDRATHTQLAIPTHANAKPAKYVPEARLIALPEEVKGSRAVVCNYCSYRLADLDKQHTLPFWMAQKQTVSVAPPKKLKEPKQEVTVYTEGSNKILVFAEADVAPMPSRPPASQSVYDWRDASCPSCRNTVGHIGALMDTAEAEGVDPHMQYTILRVGPVVGDVAWSDPDLFPRDGEYPEIHAHDGGHERLLFSTKADGDREEYLGAVEPAAEAAPPAANKTKGKKQPKGKQPKGKKKAKAKATRPLPIVNVFKSPGLPKLDISRLILPGVAGATPVVICDEQVMAAVKLAFDQGRTPYLGQLVGKSTRMGVLLKVTRATYLKRDQTHKQGALQLYVCVQNVGRFTVTGDVASTVDGVSSYPVAALRDEPVTDPEVKEEIVQTALEVARVTEDPFAEAKLEALVPKAVSLTSAQLEQLSFELLGRSCGVQGSEKLSRFLAGRSTLDRVQSTHTLAMRLLKRAEEQAHQQQQQQLQQQQRRRRQE